MSGILEEVVWPGMSRLEPKSKLGGVLARKPGYHNSRDHLPASDYSVREFSVDRQGEADEGCAIDWTFPDAQAGDYRTISKYSKRLLAAGQAGRTADPRTVYIREFFGQIDSDSTVEGWDFAKHTTSSSDSSHLWHIHISLHRAYSQDAKAAAAILSILSGESVQDWQAHYARKPTAAIDGDLPELQQGDEDQPGKTAWIRRAQAELNLLTGAELDVDGAYGAASAAAVKELMASDSTRSSTNGSKIGIPEWRRLYGIWA